MLGFRFVSGTPLVLLVMHFQPPLPKVCRKCWCFDQAVINPVHGPSVPWFSTATSLTPVSSSELNAFQTQQAVEPQSPAVPQAQLQVPQEVE